MEEIRVKFNKKISLLDFDKQIPKLVENFPVDISVLITVRIKKNHIEAILSKNPNQKIQERWKWNLETDDYSNLKDYFQTIN